MIRQPERLAGILYEHYCDAVGGKAFDGNPLPDWVTFRADPAKAKQANAWIAVAERALELLGPAPPSYQESPLAG